MASVEGRNGGLTPCDERGVEGKTGLKESGKRGKTVRDVQGDFGESRFFSWMKFKGEAREKDGSFEEYYVQGSVHFSTRNSCTFNNRIVSIFLVTSFLHSFSTSLFLTAP